MNEIKFTNKIRQALNEGSRLEGKAGALIAARLHAARERALEARRISPARELAWSARGSAGVLTGFGGMGGFSLRVLLPTVLLIVGLIAIYSWQEEQRAADIEELDALLLTSELPVEAYLDRGFEAWVKKVSAGE